jgi:hypothetical protein
MKYTVVSAAFLARKKIAVASMTMLKCSNGLIRRTAPQDAFGRIDPNGS